MRNSEELLWPRCIETSNIFEIVVLTIEREGKMLVNAIDDILNGVYSVMYTLWFALSSNELREHAQRTLEIVLEMPEKNVAYYLDI